GASPGGGSCGATVRHTRVAPVRRNRCRSVVSRGGVHVSVTLFPTRSARRSPTGRGSSNDGGCGAPGSPQPIVGSSSAAATIPRRRELIVDARVKGKRKKENK